MGRSGVHILRVIAYGIAVLVFAGALHFAAASPHERVRVDWNVPVTGPQGGHLNWYEARADPEDGSNLIVCGATRNARDNAYYGVVYSSHDGGKSWKTVLEDRGSTWVSEQSCAFGRRHTAYFVSEASKVIDGEPHHSLGTTRIFVSNDGGATWVESARTGWADYSSSIVGQPSGSDAQRLYVFFNGESKYDASRNLGSTLDFFTVSEDGKQVGDQQTIPGFVERNYQGVYPTSSVVANDGSPIVLFDARKNAPTGNKIDSFDLGVVRFDSSGPSSPAIIATHGAMNNPPVCPFSISNSLAYDKTHGVLYAAYNDFVSGHCAAMLMSSSDGGRTWAQPHELHVDEDTHRSIYVPVLSVNRDGVIGLLWRGKPARSPDCWFFSISLDGFNLDETIPLAPCVDAGSLEKQSSAYLTTAIPRSEIGQPISIDLLTFRDYLTRVSFAATVDGAFHPVWSTLGDGEGELRTATIRAREKPGSPSAQSPFSPALVDVTDKVTVLYGGGQYLDHETKSATICISLRNNSSVAVSGPLYLHVNNTSSDFGAITLVNPTPRTSLGSDYLDVSSSLHDGSLGPGDTTAPNCLTFHFSEERAAGPNRFFILKMKLRVFGRQQK
jgi:hypothetical protein